MTDNQPEKPEQTEKIVRHYMHVRQFALGLAIESERMLESLGHPVASPIVTRQERRNLTRRPKTK